MEVRKSALVPFASDRMFDLIEAAEHYPEFLPWCIGARILERSESVVAAEIAVDYLGVRFRFTTRNPKRRPEWLAVALQSGPFRRFEGEWLLRSLAPAATKIDFALRWEFGGGLANTLAGPVFARIANTYVDAFVARADSTLAGAGGRSVPPAIPTGENTVRS